MSSIEVAGKVYYRVCRQQDIGNHDSKGFTLSRDHEQVAVFCVRRDNQFYCYQNSCPHTGIGLEWMPDQFLDITGDLIQCATHGALFSIKNGLCIRGPCVGQSLRALDCQLIEDGLYVKWPE